MTPDSTQEDLPRRFGRYELVALLGEGGMARVYDARLEGPSGFSRRLAVKVMRPVPGPQEALRQAIVTEARVAGLLHHPSIVSVHDFGIEDDQPFVAMEWVDGLDLHRLLDEGGALPPRAALDVGIALAEALHYAHTLPGPSGPLHLVHRDLKPSNVLVGRLGEVKLVDFGLARAEGMDRAATATGIAKGSAPWMSPEQALAEPLDGRSDIFALGTVLYEMVVGRRFSDQPSLPAIVAGLLAVEDRIQVGGSLDALDEAVLGLGGVVRRCLRREPRARFESADRLATELRRLRRDLPEEVSLAARVQQICDSHASVDPFAETRDFRLESSPGVGPGGSAEEEAKLASVRAPTEAPRGRRGRRGVVYVAAALGAALLVSRFVVDRPAPAERSRAGAPPPTTLTMLSPGAEPEGEPAISPDGSQAAFIRFVAGTRTLFLRDMATGTETVFDTPRSVSIHHPAWHPDGKSVAAYASAPVPGIYRFWLDGSEPVRLSEGGAHPAFSPDGRFLVHTMDNTNSPTRKLLTSPLWLVEVETLEKTKLVSQDANDPSWSPDGNRIAYWSVAPSGRRDIWTVPAAGGDPTQVTRDDALDWSPVWSGDGRHLFFLSDRTGLHALHRVEVVGGAPAGSPELFASLPSGPQALSIDASGRRLLFERDDHEENVQYLELEGGRPTGEAQWLTRGSRRVHSSAVSPRGEQVVWSEDRGQEDLWVGALGHPPKQLTDDKWRDRYPQWLDRDRVVFVSDRDGGVGLWICEIASGRVLPLAPNSGLSHIAVSEDGRIAGGHAEMRQLYLVEPDGTKKRALVDFPTADSPRPMSWSPEGRLLFMGDSAVSAVRWGVAWDPDSDESKWVESFSYSFPRWLDAEHLLAVRGQRELVRLRWPDGSPEVLLRAPAGAQMGHMSISADRRHLTLHTIEKRYGIWMLEVGSD